MNPFRFCPVLLVVGILATAASADNRLANAGFESGDLSGWTTFGPGWRTGTGDDAADGVHGAVCDVLPEQTEEPWRGLFQNVPVTPGRTYSAGVDIRTVNIHASSSWLELQWLDEADNVIGQLQTLWLTTDQPFTPAALESVTAPPNAVAASIRGIVFVEHETSPDNPEFIIFDNFRFERH